MAQPQPCDQIESWINDALDAGTDPRCDSRISSHVAHCKTCGQVVSDFVAMEQMVFEAFSDPVAVAERQRIASRLSTKRKLKVAIGAMAASIMMLVVFERTNFFGPTPTRVHASSEVSVSKNQIAKTLPSKNQATGNSNLSLVTCYEITSELPGIRPIRGGVDATLNLLQRVVPAQYFQQSPRKRPGVGDFRSAQEFSTLA